MPKYLIYWNAGYGRTEEEVEADTYDEAQDLAYDAAREEFESNCEYGVEEELED
jgi:hypothetical protein